MLKGQRLRNVAFTTACCIVVNTEASNSSTGITSPTTTMADTSVTLTTSPLTTSNDTSTAATKPQSSSVTSVPPTTSSSSSTAKYIATTNTTPASGVKTPTTSPLRIVNGTSTTISLSQSTNKHFSSSQFISVKIVSPTTQPSSDTSTDIASTKIALASVVGTATPSQSSSRLASDVSSTSAKSQMSDKSSVSFTRVFPMSASTETTSLASEIPPLITNVTNKLNVSETVLPSTYPELSPTAAMSPSKDLLSTNAINTYSGLVTQSQDLSTVTSSKQVLSSTFNMTNPRNESFAAQNGTTSTYLNQTSAIEASRPPTETAVLIYTTTYRRSDPDSGAAQMDRRCFFHMVLLLLVLWFLPLLTNA